MSLFEYISVSVSIILALGIARLLTAFLDLLRFRKSVTWHWVPLIWGLAILIIQFQFWWQIFALDELLESLNRSWRNVDYLVMVLYTIMLFAAGGLVMPSHQELSGRLDLLEHFRSRGKLALLALLGYVGCGVLLVWVVLGHSFLSKAVLTSATIAVIWAIPILGAYLSRRQSMLSVWTGVFALAGIGVWIVTVIPQH